jgi:low affinity Fe/Cu permease
MSTDGLAQPRHPERETAARAREQPSLFARLAERFHRQIAHPWFFAFCFALIALWVASYPLFKSSLSWEASIHTAASVITLLVLGLIENSARRTEQAMQEKLNVLAEALAALMESRGKDDARLLEEVERLREAVGLEDRAAGD